MGAKIIKIYKNKKTLYNIITRSELVQRFNSIYKIWRKKEKFSTPRKLTKYLRR